MRVILIAVKQPTDKNFDNDLDELQALSVTCGLEVENRVIQKLESINPTYYFNLGKLESLKEELAELEIDGVVANDELSALQLRKISQILPYQILDRTNLILEIFALGAKTKEAILQVEIATKQYEMSHLIGSRPAIYSQLGGSGFRGKGETQLELERRSIKKTLSRLKRELKTMVKQRKTQRKSRKQNQVKQVALVGYTNSGKSSLLNILVGGNTKKVEVMDSLFATLQTASRKVEDYPFSYIVTDTVGFINKLPTYLVSAFRSTLEEIKEADLLLQVVDLSCDYYDQQIRTTNEVLKELDCLDLPMIYVYNKNDLVNNNYKFRLEENSVVISCSQLTNITELRQKIKEQLYALRRVKLRVPFEYYALLEQLKTQEEIIEITDENDGAVVIADIQHDNLFNYQDFVI